MNTKERKRFFGVLEMREKSVYPYHLNPTILGISCKKESLGKLRLDQNDGTDVPLDQIPNILTGKDADTVDGFHHDQNLLKASTPQFAGLALNLSSPSAKLYIKSNTVDGDITIIEAKDSANRIFKLRENSNRGILEINNDSWITGIKLDTGGDSYLTGGNVGIGMTNPSYKLDVNGDINLSSGNCYRVNTNAMAKQNGTDLMFGWIDYGEYINAVLDGNLYLVTNGNNRITIDQSGNVGIGTTNPGSKLELNGNAYIFSSGYQDLILGNISNNSFGILEIRGSSQAGICFVSNAGDRFHIYNNFGNMHIYNATDEKFVFQIDGDGNTNLCPEVGNVSIKLNDVGSAALDINSNTIRLRSNRTITNSGDAGNQGDICWDSNYIYICVSINTWKRVAIATW